MLARPFISRRHLLTGAAAVAAMAALPREAHAAATGWNIADANAMFLVTNTSLTSQYGWKVVGTAVDVDNKKIWTWDSYSNQWNGAAIGSENPAGPTGGYTNGSLAAGPYFPMWSGVQTTSGVGLDTCTVNFGATPFFNLPSGYSSVNTLASATVTWDPSNKSSDITLSNSNMTATKTGSDGSFKSVKATSSISTGKMYFECFVPSIFKQVFGFANSTASTSNYPGSDTNGIGGYSANPPQYLFNSAFSGSATFANSGWHDGSMRATNASATGQKRMFEAQITISADNGQTAIGIGKSNADLLTDVGNNANSYGFSSGVGGNHYTTNSTDTGADTLTNGTIIGIYVDTVNGRLWFYNPTSGHYNSNIGGTPDPATDTLGFDISGLGAVLYPMTGGGGLGENRRGGTVVANFAGSFSSPVPAGFCAWDGSGCSAPRAFRSGPFG